MSQAISILADLIACKSISKNSNEDIVDYLDRSFRNLGFATKRIDSLDEPKRANLLCTIGPDTEGGLMLSGHMDVVPVAGQSWQTDPFILTKNGHQLFGRGTADMKGFIACVSMSLKNISFKQMTRPLSLLWTFDEEVGATGSALAAPLLNQYLPHLPKAALIGEPTDFAIFRMQAGHVTAHINIKGKGVHSSNPDLGLSAIKGAHLALKGIFALEEELKNEIHLPEHFARPFVLLNVGEIHGGSAANIVPDETTLTLGFRPLPKMSVETIFNRILDAAKKWQDNDKIKISGSIEKIGPAMMTKPGSDLEKILTPLAKPSKSAAAQFATDAGNLSLQGIECIIFGPGSIDVAHQANEWIDERDLDLAIEKLTVLIKQWCF